MKEAKRKELYECTIHGLIDTFKSVQSDNEMDAIDKSIAYILKYGLDRKIIKIQLTELIYTLKNQVAMQVAKKQLEANPNDLTNMQSKEYDAALKYFFSDPVGFIQAKLEDDEFYNSIKPKEDNELKGSEYKGYIYNLDKNRKNFINLFKDEIRDLRADFKSKYQGFENGKVITYDILKGIEARLPEYDHSIENAFKKQNPGTWEKRLNKTSKEYKDFKKTFNDYKNKLKDGYGDDKALEDAAMRYLRHKFPKLKEGELPTAKQISRLSGAGKYRADFCKKVIESCRETHTLQPQINKMVNAVKGLNLDVPTKEDLKPNAVLREKKPEAKVEGIVKKGERKKGGLRTNNGPKSEKKKVDFKKILGHVPVRTKTEGGSERVPKLQPKKAAPVVKEEKVDPVKQQQELEKKIADSKSLQESLKNDIEDKLVESTKIEIDTNIELTKPAIEEGLKND